MNILQLLPSRVRATVYLSVTLLATAYGVYVASEGDWLLFAGNMVVALQGLMAANNIEKPAILEGDD
jgi:hypothetical protein